MKKYILIGIIIAVIALIWLIYGDFLMAFMGKKVPEVSLSCQTQDSAVFSLKRVKNEFIKETGELQVELASIGNTALERIKNITFLATVVKSIFGR